MGEEVRGGSVGGGGRDPAVAVAGTVTAMVDEERRQALLRQITEEGGFAYVRSAEKAAGGDLRAAEAAREMAWEQLHSGPWQEVGAAWRDAYAMACLHVAELRARAGAGEWGEALRALDMGLIMGGPLLRRDLEDSIGRIAARKHVHEEAKDDGGGGERAAAGEDFTEKWTEGLAENRDLAEVLHLLPSRSLSCKKVQKRPSLSLEAFICDYFLRDSPVIISDCIDHWPARTKWKDLQYLERVAGNRTVPVEIRELRDDIMIPDYCFAGDGELQSLNAWFGPVGTVTPLHNDPHHNLFAQVVGRKYIRLYPDSVSEGLYPHNESMLRNSSQVDLDNIDLKEFPKFEELEFFDCVLEEGEMLYIPPKWWHYVRSLSTSFSVSFWWKAMNSENN